MTTNNPSHQAAGHNQPLLEMETDFNDLRDGINALRALSTLLLAEQDDKPNVDVFEVGLMLEPIVTRLRESADRADDHWIEAQNIARGNAPASGENDLRLCRLAREYRQIVQWECEVECDLTPRRKREVLNELLSTPANSFIGVAAKLHAVSDTRENEPSAPGDKLEHRAMREIERLAGFDPDQDDRKAA